jgi:hypothetical protein
MSDPKVPQPAPTTEDGDLGAQNGGR